MPCLAITLGQARQAPQRCLIQSATMASRTRSSGGLRKGRFISRSAAFTPFRQAFFSDPCSITPSTGELVAAPSQVENHGKATRVLRQAVATFWRPTHCGAAS